VEVGKNKARLLIDFKSTFNMQNNYLIKKKN
jgi:hypothetical protein